MLTKVRAFSQCNKKPPIPRTLGTLGVAERFSRPQHCILKNGLYWSTARHPDLPPAVPPWKNHVCSRENQ